MHVIQFILIYKALGSLNLLSKLKSHKKLFKSWIITNVDTKCFIEMYNCNKVIIYILYIYVHISFHMLLYAQYNK